MNPDILASVALVAAGVPTALFISNLSAYRSLNPVDPSGKAPRVSVLIPARNEEHNIRGAVESVLGSEGVELELIVLDDGSSDRTPEILGEFLRMDRRMRVEAAPPPPPGWCGKQHACHLLSGMATHDILVFMDADVRLMPDGLARMTREMTITGAQLLSGVPRQITSTFSERLLVPLIHFFLLSFLPMHWARKSRHPAFGAGCGQLFAANAEAYHRAGGHAAIRGSLHDGLKLPRAFRNAGFRTSLFDATDVASCRMYTRNRDVWSGLAKNATEGVADPKVILPMTALLLCGQVLPWALMFLGSLSESGRAQALLAIGLTLIPRMVAARRFQQPLAAIPAHVFSVVSFLFIQWFALLRSIRGGSSVWKGRAYPRRHGVLDQETPRRKDSHRNVLSAARLLICLILINATDSGWAQSLAQSRGLSRVTLSDQHGRSFALRFPAPKPVLILVADRKGADRLGTMLRRLITDFGDKATLVGIADVSKVPRLLRGRIRQGFLERYDYRVMLDWEGRYTGILNPVKGEPNIYLFSREGHLLRTIQGKISDESWRTLHATLNER